MFDCDSGPDLLLAGPLFRKKVGTLLYKYPPPDCLHPTRTVVIIDILLRTRAAMHTTIGLALEMNPADFTNWPTLDTMTVYDASAPCKIVFFIP